MKHPCASEGSRIDWYDKPCNSILTANHMTAKPDDHVNTNDYNPTQHGPFQWNRFGGKVA